MNVRTEIERALCAACQKRRIFRGGQCWRCWLASEWWCLTTERLAPWWSVPLDDGKWAVKFWPWPWRLPHGCPNWTRRAAAEDVRFSEWLFSQRVRQALLIHDLATRPSVPFRAPREDVKEATDASP